MNSKTYRRLHRGLAAIDGLAFSICGATFFYAAFIQGNAAPAFAFAITGTVLLVIGTSIYSERFLNKLCPSDSNGWISAVGGVLLLLLGIFDGSHFHQPFRDFPWMLPSFSIGIIAQGALASIRGGHVDGQSGAGP